jgi:hypothetical protein
MCVAACSMRFLQDQEGLAMAIGMRMLGMNVVEGSCPRCGRSLRPVHTVSQYGRPTVALLECAHCRYTCQTVIEGMWPEEAFPRASLR